MNQQEYKINRIIGTRIYSRRKELRISQGQLAKTLNIATLQLNMLEQGTRALPAYMLPCLAGELGVDIQFFFSTKRL